MSFIDADLHSHSTLSDGTLPPEALAARARERGVELWALTDHDGVEGVARARRAAHEHGLSFLTGVEISVTFAGETVHIVGLGFDDRDETLRSGLERTRGGRERRAREMAEGLARAGVPGAYEGALKHVKNPELISRTHFARFLVEAGVCSDTGAVFRKYLTEGKPGFVPHGWATLGEALGWIHGAGGAAIVAHPGRYKFTATEEYAFFSEFKGHGGVAVEVITGSHSQADAKKYAGLAQEFGLAASRGSDFHCPVESRIDLGALPWLAGSLTPVWELIEARIERPAACPPQTTAMPPLPPEGDEKTWGGPASSR